MYEQDIFAVWLPPHVSCISDSSLLAVLPSGVLWSHAGLWSVRHNGSTRRVILGRLFCMCFPALWSAHLQRNLTGKMLQLRCSLPGNTDKRTSLLSAAVIPAWTSGPRLKEQEHLSPLERPWESNLLRKDGAVLFCKDYTVELLRSIAHTLSFEMHIPFFFPNEQEKKGAWHLPNIYFSWALLWMLYIFF